MASERSPVRALEEAPNKSPHRKPRVGDSVHFYDESRVAAYARMGVGPYAAIVTALDFGGVSLFVMGPQGGRFDVEKVAHRDDVGQIIGKKRWWQWATD